MADSAPNLIRPQGARTGWKAFAKTGFQLLAYAVPAFFLSEFLLSLTGGALWVPAEWKNIILLLGFLGGLACFSWARASLARRFPPVRGPKPGQKEGKQWEREMRQRDAGLSKRIAAQKRVILWLVPTLVAIGAHTAFRRTHVQQWSPTEAWVMDVLSERNALHPDGPEVRAGEGLERSRWDRSLDRWRGPLFVTYERGAYQANLLFPIRFTESAPAQKFLAELRSFHSNGSELSDRAFLIETSPSDLVRLIEDEGGLMFALAQMTFVILHLSILFFASASYGFGYSWVEEVTNYFWGAFAT